MILLDPDLDSSPHGQRPVRLDPDSDTSPRRKAAGHGPATKKSKVPTTRTLARFLTLAQAAVRLQGQVTVLLTTDAAIKRLNQRFRGKNKPTDVLSFPAQAMPGMKGVDAVAGDLAISVPTARRQSIACGHSLGTELKILILHGLLHLAGFDHETDEGQMARRERVLRGKLALPSGLIERAEVRQNSEFASSLSRPMRKNRDAPRIGRRGPVLSVSTARNKAPKKAARPQA